MTDPIDRANDPRNHPPPAYIPGSNALDLIAAIRSRQFPAVESEPAPLTTEQRFKLAEELAAAKAQARSNGGWINVDSGDRKCFDCKFWNENVSRPFCKNPAAKLQGSEIVKHKVRGPQGLCGPEGVYWEDRYPRKRKVVDLTDAEIRLAPHRLTLLDWPVAIGLLMIFAVFLARLI